MSLIKCPSCGKQISDKAKLCVHCGRELHSENILSQKLRADFDKEMPVEIAECPHVNKNQEKEAYAEPTAFNTNRSNQHNKKIGILCRTLLILATVEEILFAIAFFEEADMILLRIAAITNIVSYILLCVTIDNKVELASNAVLLRILGSLLYLVGCVAVEEGSAMSYILQIVIYVSSIVIWWVIYQNMHGMQVGIFQKFKFLYIALPLLEPVLYTWLSEDSVTFLIFASGSFATIKVGCFYGWHLSYKTTESKSL